MAVNAFKKLLHLLSTEDIECLNVSTIIDRFPIGKKEVFPDGKTIECLENLYNESGEKIGVVLLGYVPKGAKYEKHYHDGYEELCTLSGVGLEVVTPIKLPALKKITLPKERVHGYKALTNWTFVCKIWKV